MYSEGTEFESAQFETKSSSFHALTRQSSEPEKRRFPSRLSVSAVMRCKCALKRQRRAPVKRHQTKICPEALPQNRKRASHGMDFDDGVECEEAPTHRGPSCVSCGIEHFHFKRLRRKLYTLRVFLEESV